MQIDWPGLVRRVFSEQGVFVVSIGILLLGMVLGYLIWRWTRRMLRNAGVSEAVEGTPFERTARSFGTSTVGIISNIAAVFVYVLAIVLAINVAQLGNTDVFWTRVTAYLPSLFIAALALIVGLVVGDQARLRVSERLRSIKLPEVSLIPELVKYSVFYVAILIALGQLGVETTALVVLLGVYAFAVVIVALVAFWDLLRSGAAGIYLLLNEPYSIGDRVRIGGNEGIVQEVDMFTTRIESEGEEYILPNQNVFESGIVRIRD
ncbi:mechanosensitive ion channel domain-containing protein [Halosimplex salinum]|uniref:mechanosensitive ion channel domain-containing protein n=1 Tax=Halosimplex salinum TaxID=1710538 RepID=UPI000F48EA7F|nr:mechanosensitive ion channel domain-containing protein [Halosimplex salinum]